LGLTGPAPLHFETFSIDIARPARARTGHIRTHRPDVPGSGHFLWSRVARQSCSCVGRVTTN